jgi:hypothetical protein
LVVLRFGFAKWYCLLSICFCNIAEAVPVYVTLFDDAESLASFPGKVFPKDHTVEWHLMLPAAKQYNAGSEPVIID